MGLGMPELLVIAAIIGIIFGPKLLPAWGRSLGQTAREVKNIRKEFDALHEDDKT